jgi:hypothetical protein
VPAVIRQYQTDPRRYADRSRLARAAIARNHRPAALAERIVTLARAATTPAQRVPAEA